MPGRFSVEGEGRRSVRLRTYDYSREGVYFVTVCTAARVCRLGEVVAGEVRLNAEGQVVADEWFWMGFMRENVGLDAFVVMPNHLHGIIVINSKGDAASSDTMDQ